MRYENQEKIMKAAQDKRELERNIMKEYCLAESFDEFMLNCAVKYGWDPKNIFNKYWWHYKITDVGRHKFIALLTMADLLVCLGLFGISMLTFSKASVWSQVFTICSIVMTLVSPLLTTCLIPDLYKAFNYRLRKANDELNGDGDEDDSHNSHPFTLSLHLI